MRIPLLIVSAVFLRACFVGSVIAHAQTVGADSPSQLVVHLPPGLMVGEEPTKAVPDDVPGAGAGNVDTDPGILEGETTFSHFPRFGQDQLGGTELHYTPNFLQGRTRFAFSTSSLWTRSNAPAGRRGIFVPDATLAVRVKGLELGADHLSAQFEFNFPTRQEAIKNGFASAKGVFTAHLIYRHDISVGRDANRMVLLVDGSRSTAGETGVNLTLAGWILRDKLAAYLVSETTLADGGHGTRAAAGAAIGWTITPFKDRHPYGVFLAATQTYQCTGDYAGLCGPKFLLGLRTQLYDVSRVNNQLEKKNPLGGYTYLAEHYDPKSDPANPKPLRITRSAPAN